MDPELLSDGKELRRFLYSGYSGGWWDNITSGVVSYDEFASIPAAIDSDDIDVNIQNNSSETIWEVIYCDLEVLNENNILKIVERMKSKLLYVTSSYVIDDYICELTVAMKETLIKAHKKLEMFGKKKPTIAVFDEYGRRLPDKFSKGPLKGLIVKIVDKDVKDYIRLIAIMKKRQ